MTRIVTFLKRPDLYLGIVRYVLALGMLPYALTKILKTQFVVLPAALWQRPLEDLNGTGVAWTFLGYSPWFQVLLGFLELVPALLLLFRRTTLLGAILMLPMTLNVYLINIALNLWDGTKQISLILLLLNLVVLAFKSRSILAAANVILARAKKFSFTPIEIAINLVLILVAGYFTIQPLLEYKNEKNVLTGDWYNQHPVEWTLQDERLNDSMLPMRNYKAYYGAYGNYSKNGDTGLVDGWIQSYEIDEKAQNLKLFKPRDSIGRNYKYLVKDSILQLETIFDSSKNLKLIQRFKKRVINSWK